MKYYSKENRINQQFIPYDFACRITELGFDEHCLCVYNRYGIPRFNNLNNPVDPKKYPKIPKNNGRFPAPLWQQAFDFFREKYDLDASINRSVTINNGYDFFIMQGEDIDKIFQSACDKTYHQARYECLEHLICMCKGKDSVPPTKHSLKTDF